MKKFLLSLSGAAILVACNSKPAEVSALQPQVQLQQAVDTTGLAAFKNFQMEQAIAAAYANELGAQEEAPVVQKMQKAPAAKAIKQAAPVRYVAKKTTSSPAQTNLNTSNSGTTNTASTGSSPDVSSGDTGTGTESAGETASTSEKKGTSNAVKGAVIGGVVGAGTGAVVNKKNRVVGAVIGGVIGAGGGYVIGKKTEKKNK